MSPLRRNARRIRFACLITAVLFLAMTAEGFFDRLELFAFDTELRLAPARRTDNVIAILALDERSVHRYGPLPWPPSLMARTITELDKLKPSGIGVDFLYTGEGDRRMQMVAHEPAGIQALQQAFEHSGRVVPGIFFDFQSEPDMSGSAASPLLHDKRIRQIRYLPGVKSGLGELPLIPTGVDVHLNAPEISKAARTFGHLNLLPGKDGTIRWMPLVARYQNELYASFAVEVARTYLGDLAPEVVIAKNRIEGVRIGDRLTNTDENGRLLVRFGGGENTYEHISAADLLAGSVSLEKIRNRIILIGTTAAATGDIWTIPLSQFIPGVEIHANAIDNILNGNFLLHNWRTQLITYFLLLALGCAAIFMMPLTQHKGLQKTIVAAAIALLVLLTGHYFFFTRTGYAVGIVCPSLFLTALFAETLGINYFSEERKRQLVEKSFGHYLDPKVIDELLETPERLRLGGERRELSVLFCDIRNFTSLAEGVSPEATVKMLNEFFNQMTEVIFSTEGLVDKFVGDQVMAFWGAPIRHEDHAVRACGAALQMKEQFLKLRERWSRQATYLVEENANSATKPKWAINCGIGINSGSMVVGNIGSDRRFSYTVIGDSVNISARLEALNKVYGTQILVGPDTYRAAVDQFHFREIDEVQVKGRAQKVVLYELLGRGEDEKPDPIWLKAFADGLQAYRLLKWESAKALFTAAQMQNTEDACAGFYLNRIAQTLSSPTGQQARTVYLR